MARTRKPTINLNDAPDFFSPELLAHILDIAEISAYQLAKSNGFPAMRVGRRIIISKAGLIRWLEQQGL